MAPEPLPVPLSLSEPVTVGYLTITKHHNRQVHDWKNNYRVGFQLRHTVVYAYSVSQQLHSAHQLSVAVNVLPL